MTPPRAAGRSESDGRYRKAVQFAEAAAIFHDDAAGNAGEFGDAYVTLAVHSGIASADVICIEILGEYAPTGNHEESADLLRKADSDAAKHLVRLLGVKTKAGYAHRPATPDDVSKSRRAHEALLEQARDARSQG